MSVELRFYEETNRLRIVQKFASDHKGLRMFLDCKDDDEEWYPDPPEASDSKAGEWK